MPPHRGHQFLIEFARQYVGDLTVLLCSLGRDPIPGHLRFGWLREMFPYENVRIVHETRELPQEPADHPDFWNIWRGVIRDAAPGSVDFFFASEDYGKRVAEVIGAQYVELDRPRELVPISGTAVRTDPFRSWEMLPDCVRPYFVKRVCIFGPESTGKSTLARDVARHFKTAYAWEYARPLLDPQGGQCTREDIPKIVRGQVATEEALARQANRVLICDTDVLTTNIWSDVLFGDTPPWIQDLADQRTYDLYLVTDVDVPWVDDNQRFFAEQSVRQSMLDRFVSALEKRDRRYKLISGTWDQRFSSACAAIEELLRPNAVQVTGGIQ